MATHRSTTRPASTRATDSDDEDDERENDEGGPIRTAVEVPDQTYGVRTTAVRVDRATYEEDFVVVVHDAEMNVVGASDRVPGGETFAGAVELDDPIDASQNVTVMIHRATDEGFGEFVTVENVVLLDDATVELDDSGRSGEGNDDGRRLPRRPTGGPRSGRRRARDDRRRGDGDR
ncbi:hypothetical protein G9464_04170 [Halostella sp. JP-L12]|uniref:DUF7282 domain-containing protein n=1 Tax=Halostella TaxID=1843185 RepID=UPI0013CF16A4|nr:MULTISPECIES: hypothetical protein [Halostella]NHN46792.1 hypothetical protein [Halostella sp. JP-L12]